MSAFIYGVTGGTRIHDNQSHNLVFYQLNYGHMEQVTGFEPVMPAWQAGVLPLYYTWIGISIADAGSVRLNLLFFRMVYEPTMESGAG